MQYFHLNDLILFIEVFSKDHFLNQESQMFKLKIGHLIKKFKIYIVEIYYLLELCIFGSCASS